MRFESRRRRHVTLLSVCVAVGVGACAASDDLTAGDGRRASPVEREGWMHWPVDRATSAGAWLTQGFYGDFRTYCGARGGCGTHNGYDYGVGPGTAAATC